jgi:hypothetical protein
MRRSPEALVSRLRNRRGRIITYSILAVISLALAAMQWFLAMCLYSDLIPKGDEDATAIRALLAPQFAVSTAVVLMVAFFFCLLFAQNIVMLIVEATGYTRNDLLVELWDRVQALESGRPGPASGTQPRE